MRCLLPALLALAAAAIPAYATVTAPAKDPSPTVVTRPTLVTRTGVVQVSERAPYPNTLVRFKVYPQTYGYRPTSSACQGTFHTSRRRTDSRGSVVIRLRPRKPLCAGVLYQAEALIGSGDVPDKFAHLCVRGRTSDTGTACSDSL